MADSVAQPANTWSRGLWARLRSVNPRESSELQEIAAEEGGHIRDEPLVQNPESGIHKFKYYNKYDGIQVGWPYLAHEQNYVHNRSIHRRFGRLMQRVLQYDEAKLNRMEAEIAELDRLDEILDKNILRTLSPAQRGDGGNGVGNQTRKDILMEEVKLLLDDYQRRLLLDKDLRELTRVSLSEHKDFYLHIENNNILDEAARECLHDADDCITTRTDRTHDYLHWLIYGEASWLESFRSLFEDKKNSEGTTYIPYNRGRLKVIPAFLMVSLTVVLIQGPMLILLLANINRWKSAVVVVIFGIATASGMSQIPRVKLDSMFLAMSAYMAVLVTFLANIQGSQCQCG